MKVMDSLKQKYNEGLDYLKTKKQQFTGEALENKIDEYSEVYGEILLGMNKELSEVKTKINKIDEGINELKNKKNEVTYSDFQKIKKYLFLSIALSLIAIIAAILF